MEWIKRMKLKQALFTMTFLSLSAAALLSILSVWGCWRIREELVPQEGIILQFRDGVPDIRESTGAENGVAVQLGDVLSGLQLVLPMGFFITALLATAVLFYRWKLEEPLALLTDGAARIMNRDLDFVLPAVSEDELGQLCTAFEMMRQSLLKNNRELWRQAEERKRLNAAFSHDLRNPVTVLKGSAKMAKQCALDGTVQQEELTMHLTRIEGYTERIAEYVDTMSSVQRLEQVPVKREAVTFSTVAGELEDAIHFVVSDGEKQMLFYNKGGGECLLLDRNVLFQIAENLVSNALRFARQTISVTFSLESELLVLLVADDGCGFSEELLKNGVQPFQKGDGDTTHPGMGLYLCMLLCRKHGGSLQIGNGETGASVRATLKISGDLSDF